MESHCLPIILYAIESVNMKLSTLKDVNSWWNSVYRRIFGYNRWESVKHLICQLGRLDIIHIVNMRRLLFVKCMRDCGNNVINSLMYYYYAGPELKVVQDHFNNCIQLLQ